MDSDSRAPNEDRGQSGHYNAQIHDRLVYQLRLLNLSHKDIAEAIGISSSTLRKWRRKHMTLLESYNEGGAQADGKVAKALYDRAIGQTVKETKVLVVDGCIEEVKVDKVILGDVGAQKHFLARRHPHWQDKQTIEVKGVLATIDASKMSSSALKEILAAKYDESDDELSE